MTTTPPPPPVSEPDPSALSCSSDLVGPCAGCQRTTHKYGSGGQPLCQWCMSAARSRWDARIRYVTRRPQANSGSPGR